jgi:hypothetical protein
LLPHEDESHIVADRAAGAPRIGRFGFCAGAASTGHAAHENGAAGTEYELGQLFSARHQFAPWNNDGTKPGASGR